MRQAHAMCVVLLGVLAIRCGAATPQPLKRADALRQLEEGNKRFAEGKAIHPHQDAARRSQADSDVKTPVAIILACADARVPVETVLDQGVGDVYVVRVAGNVLGTYELASLELAVSQMPNTPVIVVLGHTKCDAVHMALEGKELSDNFKRITNFLAPSIEIAAKTNPHQKGLRLTRAVTKHNIRRVQAEIVRGSPLIQNRIRERALSIFGAIYDTETGKVQWIGQHPDYALSGVGENPAHVPLPDDADLAPFSDKEEEKKP